MTVGCSCFLLSTFYTNISVLFNLKWKVSLLVSICFIVRVHYTTEQALLARGVNQKQNLSSLQRSYILLFWVYFLLSLSLIFSLFREACRRHRGVFSDVYQRYRRGWYGVYITLTILLRSNLPRVDSLRTTFKCPRGYSAHRAGRSSTIQIQKFMRPPTHRDLHA